MVQTVGNHGTLAYVGKSAATARNGSSGRVGQAATSVEGPGTSMGDSLSSALGISQPQSGSGDFTSAFQQMSSSLQAMMVQLQAAASNGPAGGTAAASATAAANDSTAPAKASTPVGTQTGTSTAAADAPAANEFAGVTNGFAQTLAQAAQSSATTNTNATAQQPQQPVGAIG